MDSIDRGGGLFVKSKTVGNFFFKNIILHTLNRFRQQVQISNKSIKRQYILTIKLKRNHRSILASIKISRGQTVGKQRVCFALCRGTTT